ncbi:sulfite exporter TauE/SafE family protein [Desulfospira joergensenii]|uniref:sulfite exporter TauE/SafE family protein n=1 Tax=Desulfospira joergensenii TaxID=53329 RepID=UPI0003B499E6|nr:sulfite exporter TauE/SafE family protein [Desulfospira joergensenii]
MSFGIALAYAGITGFAAMIHGAMGIGFPMVATPLLAIITDMRTAILILVLPTMVINLASIFKGGNWQKSIGLYWPLALYGMVGSLAGTRLLIIFPAEIFRPLLAVMLLVYLNAEKLGLGFSRIRRYPRLAMAFSGLGAGILGGTVNVMLPVLVIYALEVKMPKTAMIHVFNLCFLSGKLIQGIVFFHAGFFTADIFRISLPLTLLALGLMFTGLGLRDRIQAKTYRLWLRRLLGFMAAILLVQSVKYFL